MLITLLQWVEVIGVQTAGGIVSTCLVAVNDVGRLRTPFRSWFLSDSGQIKGILVYCNYFVIATHVEESTIHGPEGLPSSFSLYYRFVWYFSHGVWLAGSFQSDA